MIRADGARRGNAVRRDVHCPLPGDQRVEDLPHPKLGQVGRLQDNPRDFAHEE